jgi:hypothetical protein
MADKKHIYDMNAEEAVELIKTEVADYAELIAKGEDVPSDYFHTVEWDDPRLFDLYFAYKVVLSDEVLRPQLPEGIDAPFEAVEIEFNKRIGKDPIASATVLGL